MVGYHSAMPPRILNTQQVAELLKVPARTVRQWAESGKLPGTRVTPRMWVFDEGEVRAFVRPARGRPRRK